MQLLLQCQHPQLKDTAKLKDSGWQNCVQSRHRLHLKHQQRLRQDWLVSQLLAQIRVPQKQARDSA